MSIFFLSSANVGECLWMFFFCLYLLSPRKNQFSGDNGAFTYPILSVQIIKRFVPCYFAWVKSVNTCHWHVSWLFIKICGIKVSLLSFLMSTGGCWWCLCWSGFGWGGDEDFTEDLKYPKNLRYCFEVFSKSVPGAGSCKPFSQGSETEESPLCIGDE